MNIREARSNDVDEAGRIIYAAFKGIAERHNFPTDFPTVDSAIRSARFNIAHEQCFGVVAEEHGQLLGSAYAHERDPIVGIGPVSVDPDAQAGGVGRALMRALLDHAASAPAFGSCRTPSIQPLCLCMRRWDSRCASRWPWSPACRARTATPPLRSRCGR